MSAVVSTGATIPSHRPANREQVHAQVSLDTSPAHADPDCSDGRAVCPSAVFSAPRSPPTLAPRVLAHGDRPWHGSPNKRHRPPGHRRIAVDSAGASGGSATQSPQARHFSPPAPLSCLSALFGASQAGIQASAVLSSCSCTPGVVLSSSARYIRWVRGASGASCGLLRLLPPRFLWRRALSISFSASSLLVTLPSSSLLVKVRCLTGEALRWRVCV